MNLWCFYQHNVNRYSFIRDSNLQFYESQQNLFFCYSLFIFSPKVSNLKPWLRIFWSKNITLSGIWPTCRNIDFWPSWQDHVTTKCFLAKCFLAKCYVAKCFMAKCFMAKCFMAKCFLAKCFLAKCFLDKCSLAKCFLAKSFLTKYFLAKCFLAKSFLAKCFLAKSFLAKCSWLNAYFSNTS